MLGLPDQSGPHHDGLKDLTFDGPQLAVGGGLDGGSPLAVVEDGQLAKNLREKCRDSRKSVSRKGGIYKLTFPAGRMLRNFPSRDTSTLPSGNGKRGKNLNAAKETFTHCCIMQQQHLHRVSR